MMHINKVTKSTCLKLIKYFLWITHNAMLCQLHSLSLGISQCQARSGQPECTCCSPGPCPPLGHFLPWSEQERAADSRHSLRCVQVTPALLLAIIVIIPETRDLKHGNKHSWEPDVCLKYKLNVYAFWKYIMNGTLPFSSSLISFVSISNLQVWTASPGLA